MEINNVGTIHVGDLTPEAIGDRMRQMLSDYPDLTPVVRALYYMAGNGLQAHIAMWRQGKLNGPPGIGDIYMLAEVGIAAGIPDEMAEMDGARCLALIQQITEAKDDH